jgi:hypothetical protein
MALWHLCSSAQFALDRTGFADGHQPKLSDLSPGRLTANMCVIIFYFIIINTQLKSQSWLYIAVKNGSAVTEPAASSSLTLVNMG